MTKKDIVVCTIKSWNIENYKKIKKKFDHLFWHIIKDNKNLNYNNVSEIKPKYIFFPHWSLKIPKKIHENFECIAFHMTDLPFGRGGSPLQNLIIRGYKKTKIAAFRVTDELDAGPIYLKKDLPLDGSAQEIYKRASEIIFQEMIPHILKESPNPIPQKGKIVTFSRRAPKNSDISNLNDLNKIYDYIRMLDAEGYPKAFLEKSNLIIEFNNAKKKYNEIIVKAKIKIKEEK